MMEEFSVRFAYLNEAEKDVGGRRARRKSIFNRKRSLKWIITISPPPPPLHSLACYIHCRSISIRIDPFETLTALISLLTLSCPFLSLSSFRSTRKKSSSKRTSSIQLTSIRSIVPLLRSESKGLPVADYLARWEGRKTKREQATYKTNHKTIQVNRVYAANEQRSESLSRLELNHQEAHHHHHAHRPTSQHGKRLDNEYHYVVNVERDDFDQSWFLLATETSPRGGGGGGGGTRPALAGRKSTSGANTARSITSRCHLL